MSRNSGSFSLIPFLVFCWIIWSFIAEDGDEKTTVDEPSGITQQLNESMDQLKEEAKKLKQEGMKLKEEVIRSLAPITGDNEDERMEQETKKLEANVQEEIDETEKETQQEEDEPTEGRPL